MRLHAATILRTALWTSLAIALAACERPAVTGATPDEPGINPEIAWAAAALTRNPDLELLATDSAAGVFTVRIKSSREVRTVRLTELAAAPISQLQPTPVLPTTESTDQAAASNVEPPAPAAEVPEAPAASAATQPANQPLPAASTDAGNYTIDRAGGQVKVSGPGVSIVSAGGGATSTRNSVAAVSTDPIVCEGRRMLHLDDRSINVTSDAVIVRGGCELYITNSRITAGGTAIIVQDATVHIANSTIEGRAASIDAGDHARLLIRSSTFKGMQRRSERTELQDQGGNQWR